MTPKQWYDKTIGKKIDTDNYPRSNPYQCWDYFDYFCRVIGFDGSRYCDSTGYVGDLWLLRDAEGYHYYTMFDYVTDPDQFKTGDWVFWSQHVAMYYEDKEVGQNQPKPYVTVKAMNWDGVLGAFRYRDWTCLDIKYGSSDITINNHRYHLYRQSPAEKIGILGAGLNKVESIRKLDADVLIYAKITGANYFQMKDGQIDPLNTTYGDISSPLNNEYQSLPNQNSTLFYDLETSDFGDCTWHNVDRTHNVFSPSLVYPNRNNHWEYALMVGMNHPNVRSVYTFLVKYHDGYCVGIADQELTPNEILKDFLETNMINISFLDGGGSAQMGRWNGTKFEYVRDTGRKVPSAIAIYRVPITVVEDMDI